jgi:hypothetical protein
MHSAIRRVILVIVLFGLAGCAKNPGAMNKSDVEAELKRVLNLKEVSLTEAPGGGYTGTGTAVNGTRYELTVTQDEKAKQLNYKAKSDKGDVRGGFVKQY